MNAGETFPDLHHILFGAGPPFWRAAVEIFLRATCMYVFLQLVVRFIGKRFVGQLSPVEFAVSFGIGTAVGVPSVFLDVPVTHGMIAITVLLGLQYLVTRQMIRWPRLEALVHGHPVRLVHDGRISLEELSRVRVTTSEVFEYLRSRGVENIGQVRGMYLERGGQISLSCHAPGARVTGLGIVPPWNVEPRTEYRSGDRPEPGEYVCSTCAGGTDLASDVALGACPFCGRGSFVRAEGLLDADAEGR